MKRGDVVVVVLQGDYGKPRPAIVVQADQFTTTHPSITVAPVTTEIVPAPLFRVTIEPTKNNGLRSVSQAMVDKVVTVRRERVGQVAGHVDDEVMSRINRALSLWFGLAG